MKLKYEIKSLDGVPESIQELYTKDGEIYRLQVDGIEDTGELKRAYERVKAKRDELQSSLTDYKEKYERVDEDLRKALANGNNEEKIESLRTSYEDKINRMKADHLTELGSRDKFIQKALIENRATELAAAIAVEGSSKVLIPHIKARLSIEKVGEDFTTIIMDDKGKPSAATMDDLKSEFVNDPAFSHVIVGSKASGGDASRGTGGDAAKVKPNLSGSKSERVLAINQKYPQLTAQE